MSQVLTTTKVPSPLLDQTQSPLRFGILGAARIGPDALFTPAKTHPEVAVVAVACRDEARGSKYARQHHISKVHSGPQAYHDLVADPDIDVVYIPLPVSMHFEWSMRALHADKHVLVEKPMTSNADEARQIFALAEQFHPVLQRVREIVRSGELGRVKSVRAAFAWPSVVAHFLFPRDDIHFNYEMGGGCMMDMGVYPLTAVRYVTGADTAALEVTSATAVGHVSDPARIDRAMHATYALPDSVTAETFADLSAPGWGPFGLIPRWPQIGLSVALEGGDVEVFNPLDPGVYHHIRVKPKRGQSRTEKHYRYADGRGEKNWHSYTFQLHAFVDKVRGRTPWAWTEPTTTITAIETMEQIYAKAGLPPRVASTYKPEASQEQ
ncbi:NAD-P-binding protein [Trametes versicolor FP-101664 SS1]|uniref:NAD-P-binding protein n=1 Tax=Trametes versicolor (strain FP-101664) TaxID=717944 RepID=UPI0004622AEF|nr:NAD-P-binding protein [Trametes versicolor FP-101664 SS1]EIW57561.1 NAD-P-binding protein [Trametes versicolor FP-101664 SS1]